MPETIAYSLQIAIEDTGCGIAQEDTVYLFQPFIQTRAGLQSEEETGLGLAISSQFVQLMCGEIRVGQGTLFHFEIPIQIADLPEVDSFFNCRVVGLVPHKPAYRILIVDDRHENRDLMLRLLRLVGFDVRTASDGQEAVMQWQIWQPHLIWMDIRMPTMNGYEATRQIRALEAGMRKWKDGKMGKSDSETAENASSSLPYPSSPHPPTKTIALTASAFEEEQANILAAGCDDLVRKPFQERDIFEKIAQHLGVKYLYESADLPRSTANAQELTSDQLAILPQSWLKQLYQAALCTDEQAILDLVQELPELEASIAATLRSLVDNFRCDRIMNLMKPLIGE